MMENHGPFFQPDVSSQPRKKDKPQRWRGSQANFCPQTAPMPGFGIHFLPMRLPLDICFLAYANRRARRFDAEILDAMRVSA